MKTQLHELEQRYARVQREIPPGDGQVRYLLRIYEDLIIALSEASQLHFNTLFARVSFVATRFALSRSWTYALQIPRREIQGRELTDEVLYPVVSAAVEYLFRLYRQEIADDKDEKPGVYPPRLPELPHYRRGGRYKKRFARVIAVGWDRNKKTLDILDEEEPDTPCKLYYAVAGVNDIFAGTLELALEEIDLPLILGLTDVECTGEHHYIPSYIVILPDLLLDVTSVISVAADGADPPAYNAMDMFLPSEARAALLKGHVANYFFDELIRRPDCTFKELFTGVFKVLPIEFSLLKDDEIREMQRSMESQYETIVRVIGERFPAVGIDRRQCVIEPSFYSPQYGIKGRLDVFFEGENRLMASIIELKSSKPFRPNSYGLSEANYRQTLLYDLLIHSVYGGGMRISSYILYSAVSQDPLRFAVAVPAIQKETIHYRNQLALLQFRLMHLDAETATDIFSGIDPARYEDVKGYVKRNIGAWHQVYSKLTDGERAYFRSFTAFVTREHMLARIGSERGDGAGGLAGLWLDTAAVKDDQYRILRALELKEIREEDGQTLISFNRTEHTNTMANFRAGDIAVMYPFDSDPEANPVKNQLYRAGVLAVNTGGITIRLRNMQIHTDRITKVLYWNLEPDLLDSSFRSLYQSLWALISAGAGLRQYILGLVAPPRLAGISVENVVAPEGLSPAQSAIYTEGLQSGCLYLLWGPPGTGKTSIMLKSWAEYYFRHTTLRIALLAYTNRAVDEICETLHTCGSDVQEHYIRIGSRAATGEAYRRRLLDHVIRPLDKRADIRNLLDDTRIFVGTVASLLGKSELFNLVSFDIAIMDEASQLLEPGVVGLLTKFKKTILIGDHLQLPAVSVQPRKLSRIRNGTGWNEKIGLTDMGMSYFERMYRLYQAKGWHHLIGTLHEQGRMHTEIMSFVNDVVYNGILEVVDKNAQTLPMDEVFPGETFALFRERMVFIPSGHTLEESYLKTNRDEAQTAVGLIAQWQEKLREKNMSWSIGVITPFRAQIAAILHQAHQQGIDLAGVTVDTVERYQGGARDIIIMSGACNSWQALAKITSRNDDGIDRKLNVAVTRAREQFILIGNEEILKSEPGYRALIERCKCL